MAAPHCHSLEQPPLPPIVHPQLRLVLDDALLVHQLVRAFGSPLNLVFPERAGAAAHRFRDVLRELGVSGAIYMAHKPTKSDAIVREIAVSGVGIDVASAGELRHALACGVSAREIEATGPKSAEFLTLAVQHGVLLNADTLQEVEQARALHRALGKQQKLEVLVRFHGLVGSTAADTQFGSPRSELGELLDYFRTHSQSLLLRGFSFHLSAPSPSDKQLAITRTIEALLEAQQRGFSADVLNIGGGFRVNFVESAEQWEGYLSALKRSVMRGGMPFGWNRSALGYRAHNGMLTGAPIFHEHYVEHAGADELRELLTAPMNAFDGRPLHRVLEELMISLWVEPGRAMLDQAGITVAQVMAVKRSAHGEAIAVLDMNRTNLNSLDLEPMADPILLTNEPRDRVSWNGFLAGNLCLYSDLILRHRVCFDRAPRPGDLIGFANTAGYNMDFAEATPLMQRTAERIALRGGEDGSELRWFRDAHYLPAAIERGFTNAVRIQW